MSLEPRTSSLSARCFENIAIQLNPKELSSTMLICAAVYCMLRTKKCNHGNFMTCPWISSPHRQKEGWRHSPCPSQQRCWHWAVSNEMCPGWLVRCLIYVWGQWQSLTYSASLSNLNVQSEALNQPTARPCPRIMQLYLASNFQSNNWQQIESVLTCSHSAVMQNNCLPIQNASV